MHFTGQADYTDFSNQGFLCFFSFIKLIILPRTTQKISSDIMMPIYIFYYRKMKIPGQNN